ncbi:MAG: GreA/GreB family elongation factor [Polyangiaceae bacterium]
MSHRLILSTLDHVRLAETLAKHRRSSNAYVRAELTYKLRHAKLYEPSLIPSHVVTMNSRALLLASSWSAPREYILVYPDRENCLEQRISVLSALGVRLLGCRAGSTLKLWNGSRSLQLTCLGLSYQPEAHKQWHL